MLLETVAALAVRPDGFYVDATLGGGGHSRAILELLGPDGRLLALDLDPEPLQWARTWSSGDPRLRLQRLNFADLADFLARDGLGPADGLVADLGLNSRQLLTAERGFSFSLDGPLDMRLDQRSKLTAAEVINEWPEKDLAEVFRRYGEERASRRLARMVVERRADSPLTTTGELAAVAEKALGRPGPRPRIHPATRMFMALRLAINGELENLERFLASARSCLKAGGRLAVISFHSLEDRLVKRALRGEDGQGPPKVAAPEDLKRPAPSIGRFRLERRKAWKPSDAEIEANPRARSARLRAAVAV
jgi:16S rRNA (cytosine1402-N4)-methyltransferase